MKLDALVVAQDLDQISIETDDRVLLNTIRTDGIK